MCASANAIKQIQFQCKMFKSIRDLVFDRSTKKIERKKLYSKKVNRKKNLDKLILTYTF